MRKGEVVKIDKYIKAAIAIAAASVLTGMAARGDSLRDNFVNPPDSARPHTWWHWMNGNVSKEGITADLEAMKANGIAGANIFAGGFDVPPGPVGFGSDEWYDCFRWAAKESRRLGISLGMMNCAGWAASGGPWVAPSNSMKELVFSETVVKGPMDFSGKLPREEKDNGFYEDIAVLAFPTPSRELEDREKASSFTAFVMSGTNILSSSSVDGLTGGKVIEFEDVQEPFPHKHNYPTPGGKRPVPEFVADYGRPVRKSAFLFTPELSHFERGAFAFFDVGIMASDDGVNWKVVRDAEEWPTFWGKKWYPLSLPFPPTCARYFKASFKVSEAIPGSFGFMGFADRALVKDLRIKIGADRWENVPTYNQVIAEDTTPEAQGCAVPLAEIQNVTASMRSDGTLEWKVPAGEWTIMRIGARSTGSHNHPAPPEGTGPEVDKMDAAAVRMHLDAYVGKIANQSQPYSMDVSKGGLNSIVLDGMEYKLQNWTTGLDRKFRAKCGYDPVKWLACLSGRCIETRNKTERFLWDYRRVCADLFAENYTSEIARYAHEHGMTFSNEPHGMLPMEDLQFGQFADVPMGEFWCQRNEGDYEDGDVWQAASLAHVFGHRYAGAEAFTAVGRDSVEYTPVNNKANCDHAFTEGANRFYYHTFIHSPWKDSTNRAPGFFLGMYGMRMDRLNTWWSQAKSWIQYHSRCQFLLQQGRFVADVLYFTGDGAPQSGRRGAVPWGYKCDSCPFDALKLLDVKDGKLVLPSGMEYEVLMLPELDTMRLETIRIIDQLARAGARIVGPKPSRTPGLKDYPSADAELQRIADGLWDGGLVQSAPIGEYLEKSGIIPDVASGETGRLGWTHRRIDGGEVYFVATSATNGTVREVSFRVTGKIPELWNAVDGTTSLAPAWKESERRTVVRLDFVPQGSWFVVFRKDAGAVHGAGFDTVPGNGCAAVPSPQVVSNGWNVCFPLPEGPANTVEFDSLGSWTGSSSFDIKHFSGTATYENEVTLEHIPNEGERLVLDLGEVRNFADVEVNGRKYPSLVLRPFAVDVTDVARNSGGRLLLKVQVTNLWTNRMIGDEKLPDDGMWRILKEGKLPDWVAKGMPGPNGRRTFSSTRFSEYGSSGDLLPSGLLGPVVLSTCVMRHLDEEGDGVAR